MKFALWLMALVGGLWMAMPASATEDPPRQHVLSTGTVHFSEPQDTYLQGGYHGEDRLRVKDWWLDWADCTNDDHVSIYDTYLNVYNDGTWYSGGWVYIPSDDYYDHTVYLTWQFYDRYDNWIFERSIRIEAHETTEWTIDGYFDSDYF